MGLSPLSRNGRRALLGAGVAIVALCAFGVYDATSGDEGGGPVDIEFALGGGTTDGTRAEKETRGTDLAIHGRFRGLAATRDDTVYLLTEEEKGMVLWVRRSSGATERIPVTGMEGAKAGQAAVAPDGSVYLAAGDLWKVSPGGAATKVVDTRCPYTKFSPLATKVGSLCVQWVTGVTVTEDGSVYIGDRIAWGNRSSFVHRISGDAVELVAGRSAGKGESLRSSNPAVRKGIDPPSGTRAKDVLVPGAVPNGRLASDRRGVYWQTGPGIVRIDEDGTLSPVVAARKPGRIGVQGGPFEPIGHAVDAELGFRAEFSTDADLTASSAHGGLYYTDTSRSYSPPYSEDYRWGGKKSAAQKSFMAEQAGGKAVFQVADGEVSSVAVGAQAIAAGGDSLYIAAESVVSGDKSAENWRTAVLQLDLPQEK
ncbi:hypothetical protein [Streptomyces sp. NPDC101249]|uniref:hypothetical protein n=1 Tax=Streptomyces sp. NPDC101249 TaxID=3366140 RepID=UPI00382166F8